MEDYIVKTCPFCKTDIQEGDAIKVCPACGISHHEACWEENKGCMTFGCSEQHHEEQHTNSPDICQNCGAPFGDGQDFCHKCGTKRNATSTIINMNKDKSPKKRALIGVLISAVALAIVLIIALYVYPKYITPQINLSKAESAFKSLDYVSAVDYYEKSGFQNDDENVSQYTYAVAITQFESKDYREAAKNFNKTGKLLDSENKIFDCGIALKDTEEYNSASDCFALLTSDDAKAYGAYCDGMVAYKEKDYSTAISRLKIAETTVAAASTILPQVYFEYGCSLFDKKDYSSATTQFEKAGDYSDAKTYVTACALMNAEELLNDGHFNDAQTAFNKLPQDFTFSNISVSKRVSDINNASVFGAISGKWSASKNYIESRNIYTRTGSWDSWYIDKTISDQSLEVYCFLNSDNTVTIKGSVSFYRFTDYSSLSAYCNATQTTKSFTISNVKSIPSSYNIDDNTVIKYSNGMFSITYSVRDNYSSHFYNLYNSSVTFGDKTKTY